MYLDERGFKPVIQEVLVAGLGYVPADTGTRAV